MSILWFLATAATILCGSLYRHTHNNSAEFFQYIEIFLAKLANGNKEVYICGDFNFDL